MSRRRAKSDPQPIPASQQRTVPLWLGWLGLLLVCTAAYYPALHGGMLWDDHAHVTRSDLQSLAGLGRIWFELGATQQYYPVLHSAFWLEHRLWGDATFGYHAINLGLHAVSAGLIVVLMRQLKLRGAWLAAGIFALHPVCVESVAWISEQKNTLSTVFYLLALSAWLRFDQHRTAGSPGAWRSYALASGLFILAGLSKTVTVTLPAALLVIAWWQRGRISWRRDVGPLLPWFAFALAAGLMTAWVERTIIGAEGAAFTLGWLQRGLLAGRVVWFYFGKLIWPAELIFIYPRWSMETTTPAHFLGAVAALALVLVLWFRRDRTRGPLAAALLFGGTLFPALGFFNVYPFQFSYVADHFQYLASIALIVPLAAGLSARAQNLARSTVWARRGAAGLLCGVLGFLTWQQAHDYRDNLTLYRATIAKNPACWLATYNLGMELAARGEHQAAIASYRDTLRLRPDYAEVQANLAMSLAEVPGGEPEAIAALAQAIRLKPALWQARLNLANILLTTPGRLEEAMQLYRDVLKVDPSRAEVLTSLGYAVMQVPGRESEALGYFELALKLMPDNWSAHYQISRILLAHRPDVVAALPHLEAVVRARPEFAAARFHLGKLLLYMPGRRDEAVRQLQIAVQLEPGFAEARALLAEVAR